MHFSFGAVGNGETAQSGIEWRLQVAAMKYTRKQKQARLMAEAQSLIEEFLNWEEHTDQPDLTQIEDVVLRLRERLGQRMAEIAIADQEATQPVDAPNCPTCGAGMRYKGQKEKRVGSRVAELRLDRAHYYCARCQSGLFPPGPPTAADRGALE